MPLSKKLILSALALCAAAFAAPALAVDGTPDPSFGIGGEAFITPNDVEARELQPYAVIEQPDGKLLVAGQRNKYIASSPFDPHMRAMLARFNADGSPDTSFGNIGGIPGVLVLGDLVPNTGMQIIEAMQRLDDGSIVVAGTASAFGPLNGFVLKLHDDGTMDHAFGDNGVVLLPTTFLHALAVDSQGRLLVAGEESVDTISHAIVVRLGADGSPDSSFGPSADGYARLAWDGVDGQGGYLTSLAVTANDGVVAAGSYEVYGSGLGSDFAVARLDADGLLDPAFNGSGWRVFHSSINASNINGINRLLLDASGAMVFAGYYNVDETGMNLVLGALAADGSSDPAFGDAATPGYQPILLVPDAWSRYASGLERQSDGKLVVSVSYALPGKSDFLAFRTSATGVLDETFADGGIFDHDLAPDGIYSDLSAMTLDALGRPILTGRSERTSPIVELAVMRLTNDSVGPTLRTIGGSVDGLVGTGLVLQQNGGDDLAIRRDGTFTFATALADGSAYAVTVLTQPGSPAQTCSVDNGSGTVGGSDVADVHVICVTDPSDVVFANGFER
jgi:uncharacterized delta-60 repeat protein